MNNRLVCPRGCSTVTAVSKLICVSRCFPQISQASRLMQLDESRAGAAGRCNYTASPCGCLKTDIAASAAAACCLRQSASGRRLKRAVIMFIYEAQVTETGCDQRLINHLALADQVGATLDFSKASATASFSDVWKVLTWCHTPPREKPRTHRVSVISKNVPSEFLYLEATSRKIWLARAACSLPRVLNFAARSSSGRQARAALRRPGREARLEAGTSLPPCTASVTAVADGRELIQRPAAVCWKLETGSPPPLPSTAWLPPRGVAVEQRPRRWRGDL
ncbi:hypothetical protein AOLI_G00306680 [Acnodon oligacanthus]